VTRGHPILFRARAPLVTGPLTSHPFTPGLTRARPHARPATRCSALVRARIANSNTQMADPLIIAGDAVPVDDAPFEEPAYTVDHLSAVLRPVMLTMVLAR
jgi:hypothetical protein